MANNILVYIEQRNGQIKKASFEAAKVGADFASKFGSQVEAIIIGGDVEDLEKISGYGVIKVTHYKNSDLVNYSSSAYGEIVANHAIESKNNIIVFSNTSMGKDLAPRISAKLDCGIAMDCTQFEYDGDDILASRPVYAGKALIDVKINSVKKIFTIRPNVFATGAPVDRTAEIVVNELGNLNLKTKVVELKQSEGKLDVAEADIIVAGGRGLKEADQFKLVEELADQLGAAVGASRAVVDAGWRPHSEQVGQTGKTVSPSLYVALGISGAIQHLAGMRSSKYIVAINKDADAPIFQAADYGINGDLFEVVPALIEEIKKLKSN